MKRSLSLLFALILSLQLFAQKTPLTIDQAISIALVNNKELNTQYREIGVLRTDLLRIAKEDPNHFVDELLLPQRKKREAVDFCEIRYELTRKVLDLILDVRASFFSLATLEKIQKLQNDKISQSTHNQLVEERQRFYRLLGIPCEIVETDIEASLAEVKEVDLAALKETALKMRPDLLALKNHMEEIAAYGSQRKWWTIKNEATKQDIELCAPSPLRLIDTKQQLRYKLLIEYKDTQQRFDLATTIALTEVDEAYSYYKTASERFNKANKDDPLASTLALKNLLIAKAHLAHAIGAPY